MLPHALLGGLLLSTLCRPLGNLMCDEFLNGRLLRG
jgi:hypothetical protein